MILDFIQTKATSISVADKSYYYDVNTSACRSYVPTFFTTGVNCLWQSWTTYRLPVFTFPNIPAPSSAAPSWYKWVADITLISVNYNQTQQNVHINSEMTINGVWDARRYWIGSHLWNAQTGQSPKSHQSSIIWADINQLWVSSVLLNVFLTVDGAIPLSISNPDYRMKVQYHIRLAKV